MILRPLHRKLFQSLGKLNVTKIHNYLVIHKLGIGGSVIKATEQAWLLDIGYIIMKNIKGPKPPRNNLSRKFFQFSKKYVTKTKSNIQRELSGGRLADELILENKLISSLATLNCKTNRQLHRLQKMILTNLPDISNNFIFPEHQGILVEQVGDAIKLHSCRPIKEYEINWTQQINNTCFHLFPIRSKSFQGIKFLELTTRKVVPTSHKIPCIERTKIVYIRDVHNTFWQFSKSTGFTKISPKHFIQNEFTLTLPVLASYTTKLTHYKKAIPHRITLLHLIAKQKENIEILSDFEDKGNGDFLLGITRAISDTVEFAEHTGETFFSTVITGIKTLTNSTQGIINTTANGIATIFSSIGLPNLVLYILNFLIIAYLVLMRLQVNKLKFLFPSIRRNDNSDVSKLQVSRTIRQQTALAIPHTTSPPPLHPREPLSNT